MCNDDDTVQLTLDGGGILSFPREYAQQLALFLGQGPGGTSPLPNGQPVPTQGGWLQGTLDLEGATSTDDN